jgi:peptidoglycan/LPS O-acetylase OafA/YrhL
MVAMKRTSVDVDAFRQPFVEEKVLLNEALQDDDHQSRLLHATSAQLLSKSAAMARPSHVYRLSKRFAYCFVPQFIRSRVWNDEAPIPKHFPTSYLNGLRGITAIKVFTFHYTMAFSNSGFQPWGTDTKHMYLLELPIIRYFYSGFTAHVFFGIAGYLTTLRLFKLIDKHDQASQAKVLVNISGALFRRALRLYLPTLIITLITAHYIYFGYYETNRPFLLDHGQLFPGDWNEPKPEQFATYYEQICCWANEMFDLTNIFAPGAVYPNHDQHLWSILAEMKGSLFLYIILIGTAQCRVYVRLAVMCLMTYMYFLWNHWEIWVYILGAIVAQVDLLLTEHEDRKKYVLPNGLPPSPPRSPAPEDDVEKRKDYLWSEYHPTAQKAAWSWFRVFGFLVAFYFLSYPIDGYRDYAPGYITLNRLIPEWMDRKDKFYPNIGTAILLLLLARADPETSKWRRLLNTDLAQYLGKISFGLYLVHGPVLHAFGYMIPQRIWWMMGIQGIDADDYTWTAIIFFGWALSLAASVCVADVWSREVEGRCVRAVKKLEEFSFVKK